MANPISNVVEGLAQRLFFQEMYVKLTDRNRKYKDYVYRKMLVQEYLKK